MAVGSVGIMAGRLLMLMVLLQWVFYTVGYLDKIGIQCGTDPTKDKVNVTYIGEAKMMSALWDNETVVDHCEAEEDPNGGGLVIHNINNLRHTNRNCNFLHLNKTNTWTIRVRVQSLGAIQTAMDSVFVLTCAYDSYSFAGTG